MATAGGGSGGGDPKAGTASDGGGGVAAEVGGENGSGLADEAGLVASAGIGSEKVEEGGAPPLPWALRSPPWRRRPKPTIRPPDARRVTTKKKILVALPT